MMAHAIEVEIDRNFAAFQEMLNSLLPAKAGQYALLRDQQLEGMFASPGDAERAGRARFDDERYSIQLVSNEPIDLGFYSYGYAHRED